MLRGHIARQRSGRRRVFSSINGGAARLLVRFGPVAYVMGHKQRVSACAGSGEQGPHTCQHRTPCTHQGPSRSGTLLGFGPTRGSRLIYIYRGPVSFCGGPNLPRCGALWPAHPVGSGAVLRVAWRRRMGAMSSCYRRGYP
jgi:hypothetical protein